MERRCFVSAEISPCFLEADLHQELLGIAEGIDIHSPNISGDLRPDLKPVEFSRALSDKATGLGTGPMTDDILRGCALDFA